MPRLDPLFPAILQWQIYNDRSERVAGFVYAEDAAQFIGGKNAYTVQWAHKTVWIEGLENISASESFDLAAQMMNDRTL